MTHPAQSHGKIENFTPEPPRPRNLSPGAAAAEFRAGMAAADFAAAGLPVAVEPAERRVVVVAAWRAVSLVPE